jgi:hypothetical protein
MNNNNNIRKNGEKTMNRKILVIVIIALFVVSFISFSFGGIS